jgi:RNA polymerase sigma-70 factor (ECF subfamily)
MAMADNEMIFYDLKTAVEKYKRTVYGIAVTQLDSKHEADDVFQEVFLTYHRKKPSFESEEKRKAWLITVTVNKCRQFNHSSYNYRVDKTSEPQIPVFADFDRQDSDVFRAIRSLNPNYREVVYLHYCLGYSVTETAEILSLRPNTVSMRLNRAKKQLKKRLEGYGYET